MFKGCLVVLCAVCLFLCNRRVRSVVVDLISSVALNGAIGKSIWSSAVSAGCSFRLVASFILHVCDTQHSTASFEKDMIGVKPERLSTPQGS
jgi:hypothetical protein